MCIGLYFASTCYADSLNATKLDSDKEHNTGLVTQGDAELVEHNLEAKIPAINKSASNHNLFLKHKPTQATGMPSSYYFEVLTALVFILLLIGLAAWLTRRLNLPINSAAGKIKIKANMSVGAKEKLLLVTVENRKLLIGVGGGNICLIERLGLEDEKANSAVDEKGFSGKLQNMLRSASNV